MKQQINTNGRTYIIDWADNTQHSGTIKRELQVGDVYGQHRSMNPFLLVQAVYQSEDNRNYCLLGMGCSPNSNDFFLHLHTLYEIDEYLVKHGMKFVRNINQEIAHLVGPDPETK